MTIEMEPIGFVRTNVEKVPRNFRVSEVEGTLGRTVGPELVRAEARSAARLAHPNVAGVHDFGTAVSPGRVVARPPRAGWCCAVHILPTAVHGSSSHPVENLPGRSRGTTRIGGRTTRL